MATAQLSPVLRYLHTLTEDPGRPTDGQLLDRFVAQRDEAAFAALVRRHGPMVLAVCRRVLRDGHAAEDAFQATFLVLARKARALGRPECLGPWLHGVAYRTALKARAHAARRRAREASQAVDPPAADTTDEVVWRDLRPVLDEEVNRLPTRYRVPFILCYLDGLTNADAAQRLGCSRGTVATWLARARERLRGRLARRGLALSAGTFAAVLSGSAASALVPATLTRVTARAAALAVTGTLAVAGLVSPQVVSLTKGVLRTMLLTKLKIAAGCLLGVVALVVATGVWVQTALATDTAAPAPARPVPPLPPEGEGACHIHLFIRERDHNSGERKLLSRPQVMTQMGQTATVTIGDSQMSIRQVPIRRNGTFEVLQTGISATIEAMPGADGTTQVGLTFRYVRLTSAEEKVETGVDLAIREVVTTRLVRLGVPIRVSMVPEDKPARTLELIATVVAVPKTPARRPPETTSGAGVAAQQAEKDLKMAEFYQRTGQPAAAYFYYNLVCRRYPGTPSAAQAELAMLDLPAPQMKNAVRDRALTRVGQIIIIGNERMSEAVILKQVAFVPGQILDAQALKTAEDKLVRLGLFQVKPKEGVRPTVTVLDAEGAGDFKDILITVKEK